MIRRLVLAIALLALVDVVTAQAGPPTERLASFFADANRVITAPDGEGGMDERVEAVRARVNEVIDFEGAAALALGKHWEPRSAAERAEFTRLYTDLLERAYLAWLGSKARVGADGVRVRWIGETIDGDQATVNTTLLTRAGTEMPIDYRMVRRAGHWMVRDVVVDGLSLAANYHVQIDRVIQGGSYADLVARLREKASPAQSEGTAIAAAAVRAARAAASAIASLGPDLVDAARIIVEGAPVAELPDPVPPTRAQATAPGAVAAEPAATPPPPVMVAATPTRASATPAHVTATPTPATATPVPVTVTATPAPATAIPGPVTVTAVPAPVTATAPPATARPAGVPVTATVGVSTAAAVTASARERLAPAMSRPVVAPAAARAATTTAPRTFWVQVGAFRSAIAAARAVERLRPQAATITITPASLEPLARVLVGPFSERTAAASTLRDLEKRGFTAFIATE